ncbi:MAG TPA: hypothetical protein P5191_10425 [Ruminococcus sp.]|nr:hypothetical protein [Ruminococcus sp.]
MILKKILAAAACAVVLAVPCSVTCCNTAPLTADAAYNDDFDFGDLDQYIVDEDEDTFDDVEEYDPYFGEDTAQHKDEDSKEDEKRSPVLVFFICMLIGLLIALIAVGSMWAKLKTVHMKSNASDYTKPENLVLRVNTDTFLSKKVNKSARSSNNS